MEVAWTTRSTSLFSNASKRPVEVSSRNSTFAGSPKRSRAISLARSISNPCRVPVVGSRKLSKFVFWSVPTRVPNTPHTTRPPGAQRRTAVAKQPGSEPRHRKARYCEFVVETVSLAGARSVESVSSRPPAPAATIARRDVRRHRGGVQSGGRSHVRTSAALNCPVSGAATLSASVPAAFFVRWDSSDFQGDSGGRRVA